MYITAVRAYTAITQSIADANAPSIPSASVAEHIPTKNSTALIHSRYSKRVRRGDSISDSITAIEPPPITPLAYVTPPARVDSAPDTVLPTIGIIFEMAYLAVFMAAPSCADVIRLCREKVAPSRVVRIPSPVVKRFLMLLFIFEKMPLSRPVRADTVSIIPDNPSKNFPLKDEKSCSVRLMPTDCAEAVAGDIPRAFAIAATGITAPKKECISSSELIHSSTLGKM